MRTARDEECAPLAAPKSKERKRGDRITNTEDAKIDSTHTTPNTRESCHLASLLQYARVVSTVGPCLLRVVFEKRREDGQNYATFFKEHTANDRKIQKKHVKTDRTT